MFGELLLASALQVGPFYAQRPDYRSLGPFWSTEAETTDVCWPVFTRHRDWWRFCWFVHEQDEQNDGYQFEIMPIWFNGRTREGDSYAGLFPLYGRHPHFLLMYDWEFALWPVWMRYRMPRPSTGEWMTSNVVLFPFVHWRSDGSWGAWPIYGLNHQRESDHRYVLWPILTWADYRADRDTAGAGSSWMLWPLYGRVRRERERQDLFLPPFFSYAETQSRVSGERGNSAPQIRVRCPWPFIEWETGVRRSRLSIFPLYERSIDYRFADGARTSSVTRWLWHGVEIYRNGEGELEETRFFPFWVKNARYFRLWPFYEETAVDKTGDETYSRVLGLFPIRWVPSVDRNWSAFWTFYESVSNPICTDHSLFWGLFKWRTMKD